MSDCRMEESYYLLTTMTTYPMTKDKLLHELIYVIWLRNSLKLFLPRVSQKQKFLKAAILAQNATETVWRTCCGSAHLLAAFRGGKWSAKGEGGKGG